MFTASADSEFVMDNLVISNLVLLDSDGDGVPDCRDECPDTAPGAVVDERGCSIEQLVPCYGRRPAGRGATTKNTCRHQQNR